MERLFPEREFFMRAQGQVRFITLTSKAQALTALIAVLLLSLCALAVIVAAYANWARSADRQALMAREATVTTASEQVAAYRGEIDAVARDLQDRQAIIEAMWETMPEDVKIDPATTDAGVAAAKVSAAIPEMEQLAAIDARQLAFVQTLTSYAEQRSARAAEALATLGLDPDRLVGQAQREGMGGPLELLLADGGRDIDPRFERLGSSIARMSLLEQVLEGVPQVTPASMTSISSGFGFRRDPFNGRGAMHRGLDFKGAVGTPIRAAAKGTVTFVGWKGGYGKTVEIRHGNGMMTRYAHMSAYAAKKGERVEAGETIGAIGNTGRSTGPHLHFEVRINNRAVNPRPFLETAPHVLEEVRAGNGPTVHAH
jgi:murein DD-endopeptidase MepM/ murein hydrolase activator NlpD